MSDKKSATSDAAMGWGILLCVFAAIGYLIWWYNSEAIKNIIRWIRYGEMWLASWFVDDNYAVPVQGQDINLNQLLEITKKITPEQIDSNFMQITAVVGNTPFILIITIISLCFGLWALFKGPGTEHRQTFDLNSFIKKQANIFPIISPFITFNPSNLPPRPPGADVPADLPIFAEALSPEEWVVYNEIPVIDNKIDEEAAGKAFAKQLGGRWKGYKNLSPYKQVMLASFCLKASRKRNDADILLGRLAQCWDHKRGLKINSKVLREARAVLSNPSLSNIVLKKCNEHAWETTALMRALVTAREEGGVLAPAQFVWLRAHARELWYPLNNLGRQSLHMEAIGAVAHFKAEKMAQRPIPRPKTDDPVKSLKEYLESSKARTLPQIDYSMSKKRGIKKLKTA